MNSETETEEAVAAPRQVEVEVVAGEEPVKNHWEEQGFLPDIARVCQDFDNEPEKFLFSADVRQIIETVVNAQFVEDFDRYSNDQLAEFADTLRRRVPQVEREVTGLIAQLSRARTVAVQNIDFI